MTSTQHVLDAIDNALDDWTVSGDAMRWTTEPPPPPPSRVSWHTPPRRQHVLVPRGQLHAALAETYGTAFREAAERISLAMNLTTEEVERFMAAFVELDMQQSGEEQGDDEDPRARALRLRQQRNTGPDRDVVHQRRQR